MNTLKNGNLKLAVQKEGRLTDETLEFLCKCGFEFESRKPRLFSTCRNFPLEIIYVRDDDIPRYVGEGIVDLGIVGQNLLYEQKAKVKKLLNLRYGFCSLVIAVPKESLIKKLEDLKGKKVATTYPVSTKAFLKKWKIQAEIVEISGSAEIAPALGVCSAIVDLTSSGSTLALNDLRILTSIYDSEAVCIANEKVLVNGKKDFLKQLVTRFKAVLSAKNYKYIMFSASQNLLPKLKKIIPNMKPPIISPFTKVGWVTISSVIKEDFFWKTVETLKQKGVPEIYVLPIEKIVT
ncbi:ATP phosphoribosyltransferase [Candidatus Gottesmanbacteria bacterium]|nr:ATP phosphoribosyltransferase [Candidatus Gottesmanbacteria bacterium]